MNSAIDFDHPAYWLVNPMTTQLQKNGDFVRFKRLYGLKKRKSKSEFR